MKALILIDIQNDFLPGGALAVPDGDAVIPVANRLQSGFDLVIATQDWHPPEHLSFAANHQGHAVGEVIDLDGLPQILWPVHCVQGTPGAEFDPLLDMRRVAHVVQKGTDPHIDSYSGFYENGHRKATALNELLKGHGVEEVFLVGLATDYCVKYTALDARRLGYRATLIVDGCRGVELRPGDVARAIDEMTAADIATITSERLARQS